MIATTGYCVTYPLLGTYDIWLLAYVILHGAFNATYWHCYHTFYSLAGEHNPGQAAFGGVRPEHGSVGAFAPS